MKLPAVLSGIKVNMSVPIENEESKPKNFNLQSYNSRFYSI